jgi:flagellar protein FliS
MTKGQAIGKAVRLINQLDHTLDMERGGQIAVNLRNLYGYMLNRLTVANVTNDPSIVTEVAGLVRKIKAGWDQLVRDGR